ncbi:MAG: hypothetical protein HKP43_04880 [Altererythrobacter sp.]|uniref:hypothetical protein n=1 Tax=uncultured Altererythrobacter sp. TaxID=500840 RepID=UPI0018564412|nr:hypothetical protein [uncultured Altererythrobacter sp.]MBT8388581.1 hypothetical protein [Altererythrobacter sp.]MBT8432527.1 hypothetical protein [Altererythrobacter sp.]NNF95095.1 hypothetical protein [Altererythrobacter sp.]NNK45947.1 hypothetical protein [Altererythrobacter sp.]
MSWATAVVLIVLISAIAGVMRSRNRNNSRPNGQNEANAKARDEEAQREIKDLRERVKVLERITVDGREARAIADEIESLRGKPDKQDG